MEESVIKHQYGYGPHKCMRGHQYKVKFQTDTSGRVSGYFKVCQRCGKDEQRSLSAQGNRVISEKIELDKLDDGE